ncbi:MAG: DUF2079 domain-containing protein [Planctomycetaceae bacterium]|nr:DUF2079 domain-containing protein [Planctomycetaceae bacterium]
MEPRAERIQGRLLVAAYLLGAAVLVGVFERALLARLDLDAFNNFDLGIYSRALYLLSWDDLNPWLTNRETRIFNDHFDPILLLAAPWAKLGEPARVAIWIEAVVVLATPLPILWLWRRRAIDAGTAAAATLYLLLSRGTLSAVDFPVHPTTWAMLPMTWLGAALLLDRRWQVAIVLTLLFACKEEFPFVGVMLAAVLLWRREWRFGVAVAAWTGIWLLFALVLRPYLLGEVQHHASHRFVDLADPLAGITQALRDVNWQRIAHLLVPLAPLAGWTVLQRCRPDGMFWVLSLPLVLIRLLADAWTAHYLAPVAPLWLFGVLPRRVPECFAVEPNRRPFPSALVLLTAVILLTIAAGPLRRDVAMVREPAVIEWAPRDPARLSAIARGREYLLTHRAGKALVQSNLIPRLVERPDVYQVAGSHNPAEHEFRYVFVEAPPHGDSWPASRDEYARLLSAWRAATGTTVIIDDGHVFLAEGRFRDLPRK